MFFSTLARGSGSFQVYNKGCRTRQCTRMTRTAPEEGNLRMHHLSASIGILEYGLHTLYTAFPTVT